jgi:hypothetical protein
MEVFTLLFPFTGSLQRPTVSGLSSHSKPALALTARLYRAVHFSQLDEVVPRIREDVPDFVFVKNVPERPEKGATV